MRVRELPATSNVDGDGPSDEKEASGDRIEEG